jgi:hypothetical protein
MSEQKIRPAIAHLEQARLFLINECQGLLQRMTPDQPLVNRVYHACVFYSVCHPEMSRVRDGKLATLITRDEIRELLELPAAMEALLVGALWDLQRKGFVTSTGGRGARYLNFDYRPDLWRRTFDFEKVLAEPAKLCPL